MRRDARDRPGRTQYIAIGQEARDAGHCGFLTRNQATMSRIGSRQMCSWGLEIVCHPGWGALFCFQCFTRNSGLHGVSPCYGADRLRPTDSRVAGRRRKAARNRDRRRGREVSPEEPTIWTCAGIGRRKLALPGTAYSVVNEQHGPRPEAPDETFSSHPDWHGCGARDYCPFGQL